MAQFIRSKLRVKNLKHRIPLREKMFNLFTMLFIILVVIITLYPILNLLAISFNDIIVQPHYGLFLIPKKFTLMNYKEVFIRGSIFAVMGISVLRTFIGTALSLFANAILAYMISRKYYLFKKQMTIFWIMTLFLSPGLLPNYLLYKKLHLLNSFFVYILPGMISVFYLLILRTYMQALPERLDEAAKLEGASDTTVFMQIISPLCKPVYAAIAILSALDQWRSWVDTMIYARLEPRLVTLQYMLFTYHYSAMGSGSGMESSIRARRPMEGVVAALAILTLLPIIYFYFYIQKYLVSGLIIGGVKE